MPAAQNFKPLTIEEFETEYFEIKVPISRRRGLGGIDDSGRTQ